MRSMSRGDGVRDQDIQHQDRVLVAALRGSAAAFNIVDPAVRAEWAKRLKAAGVEYLVLDCLRPVLDALGLDEHRDAGLFLVALDALLKEAGVSEAMLVHHMGHSGERARGDSRLRDWPDVEWRLVRRDDKPNSPRYVTAYGRDVDIGENLLALDSTLRRLTLAGGSRLEGAGSAALADIVTHLGDLQEPPSGRAIEDKLHGKHARAAIQQALRTGSAPGGLLVKSPGPKRAYLYSLRPSAPVDSSAPSVPQDTGAPVCASAPAPIGAGHSALEAGGAGDEQN